MTAQLKHDFATRFGAPASGGIVLRHFPRDVIEGALARVEVRQYLVHLLTRAEALNQR